MLQDLLLTKFMGAWRRLALATKLFTVIKIQINSSTYGDIPVNKLGIPVWWLGQNT